jgi:hypothetical protein
MRQLSPCCSHLGSTQPPRGVAIVLTERILERCRIGLQRQGKPCSQPGFGALRNFDPANVRFGSKSEELALSISCPLYPVSDRRADIRNRQLRAKSQRSFLRIFQCSFQQFIADAAPLISRNTNSAGASSLSVQDRSVATLGMRISGALTKRSRRLPACQTILNAIGNLLADGRQVEEFLFAEDICGFFGKLPIRRRLVPKVIIPIHAWHCA